MPYARSLLTLETQKTYPILSKKPYPLENT